MNSRIYSLPELKKSLKPLLIRSIPLSLPPQLVLSLSVIAIAKAENGDHQS
jgi:hypothetical protein